MTSDLSSKQGAPPPPVQNPVSGTTIDTEPGTLGLKSSHHAETSKMKLKIPSLIRSHSSSNKSSQPKDSRFPNSGSKKNVNSEASDQPSDSKGKCISITSASHTSSIVANSGHISITNTSTARIPSPPAQRSALSRSESNLTMNSRFSRPGIAVLQGDRSVSILP